MHTEVLEPIVSATLTTPIVRSTLTANPPLDPALPFQPAKWIGAGVMTIPEGFLMVMNDQKFLYLLIDLVSDTTKDTTSQQDYFWLSFDVDGNADITTGVDVNYGGPWDCYGNKIAMQFYLGPGSWTFVSTSPTPSLALERFGPTSHSRTPHRFWEVKIDFKEIGVDFTHAISLPVLHFGLRVSSNTRPGYSDFPPRFDADFSHLPGIVLATTVHLDPTGLPIAGVGLIPLGNIDATGRATTDSKYYLPVTNAAFSGVMNLIGDGAALTAPFTNQLKYRVRLDGAPEPLRQSWYNYRLHNNQWIYEYFTPDANGCYTLTDPQQTYSIEHLLFQWDASNLKTGLHTVTLEMMDQNTVVQTQEISLFIDNNLPDTRILGVSYKGTAVAPCDIVAIDSTIDPVKIDYTVYDAQGDVSNYGLYAYHGHNQVDVLIPQTFPTDQHGVGFATLSAPLPPAFPPETCAYEFRLWAHANVTNGNCYLGYTEDTMHVTFQCSKTTTPTALKRVIKKPLPLGMNSADGRRCKGND